MKKIRSILAILMIIPLGLIIYSFFHPIQDDPNSLLEYAFLLIGLPILILNLWAWGSPMIIETLFGLRTDKDNK